MDDDNMTNEKIEETLQRTMKTVKEMLTDINKAFVYLDKGVSEGIVLYHNADKKTVENEIVG